MGEACVLAYGEELAFIGLIVGPGVGHGYAGRLGQGLTTAGVRAGTVAFTAYMYACCT